MNRLYRALGQLFFWLYEIADMYAEPGEDSVMGELALLFIRLCLRFDAKAILS